MRARSESLPDCPRKEPAWPGRVLESTLNLSGEELCSLTKLLGVRLSTERSQGLECARVIPVAERKTLGRRHRLRAANVP